MSTPRPRGKGSFPTTEWTLVARLKNDNEAVSRPALDELCTQYHYPLYCFIRSKGLAHHDAEDALHDFLAKLLRLEVFEGLAAEKGRLRVFLSKAADRFLITRHHRESKRAAREVSVDDPHFTFDPLLEKKYEEEIVSARLAPDVIFDQQWCARLLGRVLEQLEATYQARDRLAVFLTLRPVLLSGGSLRDHDTPALAAGLGVSEGALRTMLKRLLRHYRKLLVAEVRQTVERDEDVEAEIAHLLSVMG